MKILFCSPVKGQCCTTSNLALMVSFIAIRNHSKVSVLQTHNQKNYLDHIFLGSVFSQDNGIDSLIRMMKSEPVSREMIDSCCVDLYQNRIHLLIGSRQSDPDMYESGIYPMLPYCINAINQFCEYTFIDHGCRNQWENDPIIKQADIIVFNMNQNLCIWDELPDISEEMEKKVFYVIGDYDPLCKYNISYFRKRYKIPSKRISVIPSNTMFRDAYADGNIIKYVLQNLNSTKDEINYDLIRQLEDGVKKLIVISQEVCKKS